LTDRFNKGHLDARAKGFDAYLNGVLHNNSGWSLKVLFDIFEVRTNVLTIAIAIS
jgi:hypothetical protein